MPFYDEDYVEFYDRSHSHYPQTARGHVVLDYRPPRDIGGEPGDILVRLDPGQGGWSGEDGYYYWWVRPRKLALLKSTHSQQRPISPIFYEVRL